MGCFLGTYLSCDWSLPPAFEQPYCLVDLACHRALLLVLQNSPVWDSNYFCNKYAAAVAVKVAPDCSDPLQSSPVADEIDVVNLDVRGAKNFVVVLIVEKLYCMYPTNIASVNLVLGCSKAFFSLFQHLSWRF